MVQECVSSYSVIDNLDGSIKITIDIPKKYKDLWMIKLSELVATDQELADYSSS